MPNVTWGLFQVSNDLWRSSQVWQQPQGPRRIAPSLSSEAVLWSEAASKRPQRTRHRSGGSSLARPCVQSTSRHSGHCRVPAVAVCAPVGPPACGHSPGLGWRSAGTQAGGHSVYIYQHHGTVSLEKHQVLYQGEHPVTFRFPQSSIMSKRKQF